LEKEVNERAAE